MYNIKFTNKISVEDYLVLRKTVNFKELSRRQAEVAVKSHTFMKSSDLQIFLMILVEQGCRSGY